METKTYTVYKFEELSEEAKEKAIEHFRDNVVDFPWSDEYIEGMKAFAEFFNISLGRWSVGGRGECVPFELSEEMEALSGRKLKRYLKENYLERKNKHGHKPLDGQCFFTGFCGDEDLLDPMRKFFKYPGKIEAKELFEDCFNAWIKAYNADRDYQYTDKSIIETIQENDYDFLENGKLD